MSSVKIAMYSGGFFLALIEPRALEWLCSNSLFHIGHAFLIEISIPVDIIIQVSH